MNTSNLVIISFFRNSASGQAQRFMQQAAHLDALWPGHCRLLAVYGDCIDHTASVLQEEAAFHGLSIQLLSRNHGGPWFGSIETQARFQALSWLGNAALNAVRLTDDVVWYVESDLIWEAHTAKECLLDLEVGRDVIAPLIFAGDLFYDVFSFRGLDGTRFAPFSPYHSSAIPEEQFLEVSSIGSAFAMRGHVARNCRMGTEGVLVGFCTAARDAGYRIFVDMTKQVRHPA